MRIAVLATNRNPLSRPFAGGQESLTAALVAGFRAAGHEVVLYAASGTPDELADEVVAYPTLPRLSEVAALDPQVPEKPFLDDHHAFTGAMADLAARDDIDVVANHSLHHLPLSLSRMLTAPVVTTLHTPPFPWMELGAALAAPSARYVAVSRALAEQWTTLPHVDVVHNGVDSETYAAGPGARHGAGALVWVGRITPEKAPHLAMEAAREAGRSLTLIGPVTDETYFENEVRPRLGAVGARDGDVVIDHVGALDGTEVARVLGRSEALVMTPVWDEPFGLVAAEAAMCGTPVVALARGGVGEAVVEGTGVLVPDGGRLTDAQRIAGLVSGLRDAAALDRTVVRAQAERHLSLDRCVHEHLDILTAAARGEDACAGDGTSCGAGEKA